MPILGCFRKKNTVLKHLVHLLFFYQGMQVLTVFVQFSANSAYENKNEKKLEKRNFCLFKSNIALLYKQVLCICCKKKKKKVPTFEQAERI